MAEIKISALPAADDLDGSEMFETVQDLTSKRTTTQDLADYISTFINFPSFIDVPDGGTGRSSFDPGRLLIGNAAGAIAEVAAGTTNQVLTSAGDGNSPTWQDLPDVSGITEVEGTANEIAVTDGTGTPVISLPATIVLTDKNIEDGAFNNPVITGPTVTNGTFAGPDIDNGHFTSVDIDSGSMDGTLSGTFNGTGTLDGTLSGSFDGDVTGTFNGTGSFLGAHTGTADLSGTFDGTHFGTFDGALHGTFDGAYVGSAFNGTVGATTPGTGAFTNITVSGSTIPTNGFYLSAANTLALATNSIQRLTVDSSGRVGVKASGGSISTLDHTNQSCNPQLYVYGLNVPASTVASYTWSTTSAVCSNYIFVRSKSASIGGNTALASGDDIGALTFNGTTGSAEHNSALILVEADGAYSATSSPGRLSIWTTPSGATTLTQKFLADNAGNIVLGAAALGTTATDGFLYADSCAGTPTGTPTTYTGRVPMVVDTTNSKLCFYIGGAWKSVTLA